MTGGRVIMGVGRGYHTREVETFGAPMLGNTANQELFEEQMEVLLKCFNEESWSFKGKHYTIPAPVEYRGYQLTDITVAPRPIHLPVEIWQPIASGKTLPNIAQRGIKGMVTLNGGRIFDQVVRAYQSEAAKAGHGLDTPRCICKCRCVYRIRLAESVAKDLRGLRAHDRKKILDAIARQLSAEPGVATRHRKILVGLVPPFEAVPPIWQLAVGEFRVFYDLNEDDKTVVVRAVRKKPPHATTEDIL